ncbi:MAG TPA: ABC transporter permease [Vicinamibacterales bacterium]|nr:ABC transporter permease [Vicinamibacterales bacterium]
MDHLLQDARYGLRTLARQPGFAATAILTLALGIGATTAIFSVVNAVVLRPMPFSESERVMVVTNTNTRTGARNTTISGPDFVDWRAQARSFEALSYYAGAGETSVTVNNVSDYTTVARVAPGYFRVFGATARIGRLFTPEEESSATSDVVVISDAYWRRQFGSDPRAIGSTLTFGQRTRTIIGVTELRYPARTDIYYPDPFAPESQSRTAHNYRGVGRLAAGVPVAQAQAEMTGIATRLAEQYPLSNGEKGIAVVPIQEVVVGDTRQTLFVLLAAVGLVLLIACANVANLLLARATARGRELVVRAAIGASRVRLLRQMLTESVVLALLAGTGGLIIARWGVSALLALAPADLPRLNEVTVDASALMFALAISVFASVIFGLAPAWHVSRVDLADGLRQGGKGSSLGVRGGWARKAFVVTEIALAVALVMGAGLLGRSLLALANVDMGFSSDGLVVLKTVVPVSGREQFPRAIATYRSMLEELRALPGVTAAGGVTSLPTAVRSNGGYWIQGGPGPEVLGMKSPQALFNVVTPDYFRTLQVPIVRGRDFNDADRLDAPFVAIINEQLAKDAFPGVDPIGRTIRSGLDTLEPMTIVGIVKDVRTRGPNRPMQAEIFMPYEQHQGPATSLNIVLRTDAADPLSLGATATRHIRSRTPEVPVRVETMEMTLANASATPRFRTVLLVVFAGVALLLAVAGVYGVMAYMVNQRVPEIGLRVALGASPADVIRLVLREGAWLVAAGLAAGAALSIAGARFISGLLFGVSARDPLVFISVSMLVAIAALAACLVPGRRALKVDPLLALRAE